jgi:hypothetical protein
MLLQTNSYIVPKEKRAEHARLLRRFRQVLARLGCDSFEVYEQVGSNWNTAEVSGRVVQIMRFRDRRHQLAVQAAERNDPVAQAVIAEFCQVINFPYQQQQGLFAVGFYNAVLPVGPVRPHAREGTAEVAAPATAAAEVAAAETAATEAATAPSAEEGATAVPEAEVAAVEGAAAVAPGETLFSDETPVPAAPVPEALAPETLAPESLELPTLEPQGPAPAAGFASVEPELGTEGIIEAAEQLSDEALDAGGDAAVADAIAAASSDVPVVETSSNGSGEPQPQREADHPDHGTARAGSANGDLDLAALLDPHIDPAAEQPGPGDAVKGNGGPHAEWADALSLDGVLDEEPGRGESGSAAHVALDVEPERNRDHVSQ